MRNKAAPWGLAILLFFLGMQMFGAVEKLQFLSQKVVDNKDTSPREAVAYGKQALEILKDHPADAIKVKVLNGMCWAYFVLGEYRDALDTGKEAESLAYKIGDKKELAVAYGSIANAYLALSDFQRALDYAMKAQSASEDANYKKGLASALVSTARIQRNLQEYQKALDNFEKAIIISQELGEKESVAWILNNIGTVYWNLKQNQKALDYYFRSLKIMKETGCTVGHAFLLNNIACVYSSIGNPTRALEYDLLSMQIYEKLGNQADIAYAISNLGRDYGQLGDYTKGLAYLDKSLQIAQRLNIDELKKILFEEYATLHETKGDYKLALLYYKKFKESGEKILNQDKNQRIAHLQVVYDVEKKQKENQLLKNNNHIQKLELDRQKLRGNFLILVTILVLVLALVTYNRYLIRKKAEHVLLVSEQKLKKMNAAKDKLFTIIAHDLGNPLNSILLSSGHLQRNSHLMDVSDRDEFILDIYRQTQGLADLLENLLQWARVQTGKIARHQEWVDIRSLTTETVDWIQYTAQKKKIRMISHVMENTMAWADKHMMKAVIRNLVTNAVKYTHPGGEIVITSTDAGDNIEVTVSDNGVGMAAEKVKLLFTDEIHESTRGTGNEKGTGLGLTLCKEFVENNGGTIHVQSQAHQGSRFSFTLPKLCPA